jgi:hypothetical protein
MSRSRLLICFPLFAFNEIDRPSNIFKFSPVVLGSIAGAQSRPVARFTSGGGRKRDADRRLHHSARARAYVFAVFGVAIQLVMKQPVPPNEQYYSRIQAEYDLRGGMTLLTR